MQSYSSNKLQSETFHENTATASNSYPGSTSKPPSNTIFSEPSNMWENSHIKEEPIDEGYEPSIQNTKTETSTVTTKSSVIKKDHKQEGRVKRKYTKRKKASSTDLAKGSVLGEMFPNFDASPNMPEGRQTDSSEESDTSCFTSIKMKDQVFYDSDYGVWYNSEGIIKDGKDPPETAKPEMSYQSQSKIQTDLTTFHKTETQEKPVVREGASRRKQKPRKIEQQAIIKPVEENNSLQIEQPTESPPMSPLATKEHSSNLLVDMKLETASLSPGHIAKDIPDFTLTQSTQSEDGNLSFSAEESKETVKEVAKTKTDQTIEKMSTSLLESILKKGKVNVDNDVHIKQEPVSEGEETSVNENETLIESYDNTDALIMEMRKLAKSNCSVAENETSIPSTNLREQNLADRNIPIESSKVSSIPEKTELGARNSCLIDALTSRNNMPKHTIPQSREDPVSASDEFTLIKQLIKQKKSPNLHQMTSECINSEPACDLDNETVTMMRQRRSNAGRKLVDIISKLKTNWSDNDSDHVDNADDSFDPYNDTSGFFVQGKSDSEGESDFSPIVQKDNKKAKSFDINLDKSNQLTSRSSPADSGKAEIPVAGEKNLTLKSILNSSSPICNPAASLPGTNKNIDSVVKQLLKKPPQAPPEKIGVHKVKGIYEEIQSDSDKAALQGEADSEIWRSRLRKRDLTKTYDLPDMIEEVIPERPNSRSRSLTPSRSESSLNCSASSLLQSMLISPSVDAHPYSRNKKSLQGEIASIKPDPQMDCSFSALLKSLVKQRETSSSPDQPLTSRPCFPTKSPAGPTVYMDNAEYDEANEANNERFLKMVDQMMQEKPKPASSGKRKSVLDTQSSSNKRRKEERALPMVLPAKFGTLARKQPDSPVPIQISKVESLTDCNIDWDNSQNDGDEKVENPIKTESEGGWEEVEFEPDEDQIETPDTTTPSGGEKESQAAGPKVQDEEYIDMEYFMKMSKTGIADDGGAIQSESSQVIFKLTGH